MTTTKHDERSDRNWRQLRLTSAILFSVLLATRRLNVSAEVMTQLLLQETETNEDSVSLPIPTDIP
jgi:hypothetical protein